MVVSVSISRWAGAGVFSGADSPRSGRMLPIVLTSSVRQGRERREVSELLLRLVKLCRQRRPQPVMANLSDLTSSTRHR